MTNREYKYLFGRIHLLSLSIDKKEIFKKSLKYTSSILIRDFLYGFFNYRDMDDYSPDFVYCQLVKYKQKLEGETVDEKRRELLEGGLDRGVVAKSEFFIHIPSMVIAFREIPNKISRKQFISIFPQLFEQANGNIFIDVKLNLIEEEYTILDAIKKFERITRITTELYPTNPNNRDVYKSIDERLKRLGASKVKQTIESEAGFKKDALLDDDSYYGVIMAVDGYGSGSVEGVKDNRRIIVTTGQSPLQKRIIANEKEVDRLKELLSQFIEILRRKENK